MQAKKKSTNSSLPAGSTTTDSRTHSSGSTATRPPQAPSPSAGPAPDPCPDGARESAFSTPFLEHARRREADAQDRAGTRAGMGAILSHTPLSQHARWTGPWEVEKVAAGDGVLHAATRRAEPAEQGGGAPLTCVLRQEALLATATFAALATPNHLTLNTGKPSGGRSRSRLGHPIHDGARHIGHITPAVDGAEERFLASFHTLRCLAANPDAAALFLEALDPETLAILGRAAMRKLS